MANRPPPDVTHDMNVLEQRYVKLRDEHSKVKKQCEVLIGKEKTLEETLSKQQEDYKQSRELIKTLEGNALEKQRYLQRSENELLTANQNLESVRIEKDILNDRLKEREEGLNDAASKLTSIQQQLFDIQAKHIPLEFERDKLMREKEALTVQNKWLDSELQTKANELRQVRTVHASEMALVQAQLDQASAEALAVKEQLSRVSEERDKYRGNMEQLHKELHDLRVNTNTKISQQEALITNLKQEAIEAMECKASAEYALEQNMHDIESLQLRVEASQEAAAAEKEGLLEHVKLLQAESETRIKELLGEVESTSQRLLEAERSNAELCTPAPLMLMDSGAKEGSTLSEILGALHDKDAELRAERAERQRLELHLDTIVREIEKKAPIIEAQRKDYKRALDTYDALNEKLMSALKEQRQAVAHAQDLESRLKGSESELKAMRQQNADLSSQVQHLLQAQLDRSVGLKPLKGMHTPSKTHSSSSLSLTPFQTQDAHDVVSENLIKVSDVAEMQKKNASLIATVRALTDELEQMSSQQQEKDIMSNAYDEEKQALMNEVEEMRHARLRQEKMVETIVSQRDMYRMAASNAPQPLALTEHADTHSELQAHTAASAELETSLRAHISELERSLGHAQSERDIMRQTKDQYSEELKHTTERASNSLVEATTSKEVVRFTQSRLEQVEADLKSKVQECDMLRSHHQKALLDINRTDTTNRTLQAEHSSATDLNRRLKEKVSSLENRQLIREEAEKRLSDETIRLRAELTRMTTSLEKMQRIESEISATKNDEILSLQTNNKNLQQSLEVARGTIDDLELNLQQFRISKDEEMKLTRNKMDKLNETLLTSQAAVAEQQSLFSGSKAKAEALQEQVHALTKRQERDMASREVGESKFYATQLDEFEAKEKQLKIDLEAAQEEAAKCSSREREWRGMVTANEKSLQEAATAQAALQTKARADLQVIIAERDELKEEMDILKRRFADLDVEKQKQLSDSEAQTALAKQQLGKAQEETQALEAAKVALSTEVAELTRKVGTQRTKAESAQKNYERELKLHAEAIDSVRADKKWAGKVKQDNERLITQIEALQTQLKESKAESEKDRLEFTASLEAADMRTQESEARNKLFNAELQRVGAEVDKLQQNRLQLAMGEEGSTTLVRSTNDDADMRKLVQSLQKEQGLLETRLKSTQDELGLKEQLTTHLNRELEEARAALSAQTTNPIVNSDAHDNKMAQEEELNVLRESNSTLRADMMHLRTKLQNAEDNLKRARAETSPLKLSLSEVTAQREVALKECEEFKNSAEQWRKRVDDLTDKYKVVDPEDYSRVKIELEACTRQLTELRETSVKEVEELATVHSAELSKTKETNTQNEQKLKRELANANEKLATNMKKLAALEQELKLANDSITKLKSEVAEANVEIKSMEERLENVRNKTRQKVAALNDELAAVNAELAALSAKIPITPPASTLMNSDAVPAPANPVSTVTTSGPALATTALSSPSTREVAVSNPDLPKPSTPKSSPKPKVTLKTKPATSIPSATTPKSAEKVPPTKSPPTSQAKLTTAPEKKASDLKAQLLKKNAAKASSVSPPKHALASQPSPVAESKSTPVVAKSKLNPAATQFEHLPPASEDDPPAAKKSKAVPPKAQAKKSGLVTVGGAKPSKATAKRVEMTGVAPNFTDGKKVELPLPSNTPVKPTTFASGAPAEQDKFEKRKQRFATKDVSSQKRTLGDSDLEPAAKKSSGDAKK